MKSSIFIWLMITGFIPALFSQNLSLHQGTTRAVIIGISDYEDEKIPDLQYAHKDAEAFANFLRAPAGLGFFSVCAVLSDTLVAQ